MKVIAIGDIHGRGIWEKILKRWERLTKRGNGADKIIFHGDYFDSHIIIPDLQIENFKKIIAYKEKYPEKITLLFGNHDFHYLPQAKQLRYSGYNSRYASAYGHLLSEAYTAGYFQMCHKEWDIWFSHAGIGKTFCQDNDIEQTAEAINDLFINLPHRFEFTGTEYTGDDITQTPIWIRPRSLMLNAVDGRHVVGHTRSNVGIFDIVNRFWFIDTLEGHNAEYLIITDGEIVIEKIK